jgi:excisionase family DNA binding protein
MSGAVVNHEPSGALSPEKACEYLGGISRRTLGRLLQEGAIVGAFVRGRRVFPVAELAAYLARAAARAEEQRRKLEDARARVNGVVVALRGQR